MAADFQTLLAALTLLERQPDGRYPQRRESQASWLLPLTEYLRMAIIGAAQTRAAAAASLAAYIDESGEWMANHLYSMVIQEASLSLRTVMPL